MMKVDFQDYYGQHISINNETASGNIRMKVSTCADMNDVRVTPENACDVVTDISLAEYHLDMLIAALQSMRGNDW